MKIKVCGLNDLETISKLELHKKIDFLGFIFYNKSKRHFTNEIPKNKIKNRVGIFVNESIDHIQDKINSFSLDYVQLHGDESADYCLKLKNNINIIKAFGVDESFDFSVLNDYCNVVDFFLFDTKTKQHGGSGRSFDWNLLNNYKLDIPFFLSGGINAESVEKINSFKHKKLYALDLNSGFEIEAGLKDIHKIDKFLKQIK